MRKKKHLDFTYGNSCSCAIVNNGSFERLSQPTSIYRNVDLSQTNHELWGNKIKRKLRDVHKKCQLTILTIYIYTYIYSGHKGAVLQWFTNGKLLVKHHLSAPCGHRIDLQTIRIYGTMSISDPNLIMYI